LFPGYFSNDAVRFRKKEGTKMKKLLIAAVFLIGMVTATVANADSIRAKLTGFEEVPVVSTVAAGEFRATISQDEQSIEYELRYSDLQGTVQQGHIHIAQLGVNGVIVIWLCQTTGTFLDPAGLAPQCQPGQTTEAVITGKITAANVIAPTPAPQQILAGELAEVIDLIRAGFAYANVHTNLSPGGEIRGQIEDRDRDKNDKRRNDRGDKDKHH
jgi:hypothetical protein